MPKFRTLLIIPAGAWLLAACSSEPTCDYADEPYMTAKSVPSLRAPDGLTTPDRSGALVIPPPPADAKPIPKGKGRCLDRPPAYYATASDKPEQKDAPKIPDPKSAPEKKKKFGQKTK